MARREDRTSRYDPRRGWTHIDSSGRSVVGVPSSRSPREVRRFARERSLVEALLSGQPIIGYGPDNNPLVPGQRSISASSSPAPATSTAGDGAGLRFQRIRRSGGAVKERWYRHWGPVPFHHILDPAGYARQSIIVQDLIVPTFDSGNAWAFFGLGNHNNEPDETSKAGIWWHTNSTDLYWTSGLYDGTGTPSNTVHETAHASLSFNATGVGDAHRLAIVVDAATKAVYWYANGVLMDSYTPTAVLDEMAFCPHLMFAGITEAGADCSIYTMGGGNPRFLVLTPAA